MGSMSTDTLRDVPYHLRTDATSAVGHFAHAVFGEIPVGPAIAPSPSPQTGSGWPLHELVESAVEHLGEHIRPGFEANLADLDSEEARELYRRGLDATFNPESEYSRPSSTYDAVTSDQANRMVGLGIEDPFKYTIQGNRLIKGWRGFGVTQERMDLLDQLGTNYHQWSGWEEEAYLHADVEGLRGVLEVDKFDELERYRATVALLGRAKLERLNESWAAGLTSKGLIELTDYPIKNLADLHNALPKSRQSAHDVSQLIKRGIKAATLKRFGRNACDSFTGKELEATLLKPAALKALHIGYPGGSTADLERLHAAGFTKAAELRDLRNVMGELTVRDAVSAKRIIDPAKLLPWHHALGHYLTLDDVKAAAVLAKHGVAGADDLKGYRDIHRAAHETVDMRRSSLPIWASIVRAKVTPERLTAMTRAGILVTQAAKFAKEENLWAAGKPFCEAVMAQREQELKAGFTRRTEVEPWAYTEADYAS